MLEILTGEYEMDHGARPRGRGNWAFRAEDDREGKNLFWFNGLYGEGVKAARKHFGPGQNFAAAQHVSAIVVCS